MIIVAASPRGIPKRCESPNAEIPYMIPKLTILALLRISRVTSLAFTLKTLAAVAV